MERRRTGGVSPGSCCSGSVSSLPVTSVLIFLLLRFLGEQKSACSARRRLSLQRCSRGSNRRTPWADSDNPSAGVSHSYQTSSFTSFELCFESSPKVLTFVGLVAEECVAVILWGKRWEEFPEIFSYSDLILCTQSESDVKIFSGVVL